MEVAKPKKLSASQLETLKLLKSGHIVLEDGKYRTATKSGKTPKEGAKPVRMQTLLSLLDAGYIVHGRRTETAVFIEISDAGKAALKSPQIMRPRKATRVQAERASAEAN